MRPFKESIFEIAIMEMLQGVKIKWIKEFLSCSEGPIQRVGVGNQRRQMVPGEGKGYCISIVVATASTDDPEKVVELNYPMQEMCKARRATIK